jgi:hypothetical protein
MRERFSHLYFVLLYLKPENIPDFLNEQGDANVGSLIYSKDNPDSLSNAFRRIHRYIERFNSQH